MPFSHILLAILVTILWGSNFVAAKFGLLEVPPFLLTGIRFLFVALLLVPFVPRPRVIWQKLLIFSILGTLHFSLGYVALGMGLDIATVVITTQLAVPFSCLMGVIFFKDRVGLWRILGMLISFMGIAIITGAPGVTGDPTAFFIVLAGAFFWGASNIMIKTMDGANVLSLLAWMALLCVPQLFALSWLFEDHSQFARLTDISMFAAGSIVYTVVASTLLGHGLWVWLMQKHPVSYVAPFSLLVPFFGIAMGQLFFKEPLSTQVILGGLLTILGVAIIVIRRPKTAVLGETT